MKTVKNYTTIDLKDLNQMQQAAEEIANEVELGHSTAKALIRLNESATARRAVPHFKAIVFRYHRSRAIEWLEENTYHALPAKFDLWDDPLGAATCHILQEAGIPVRVYNGWFEIANW